jgi:hypothetical protein
VQAAGVSPTEMSCQLSPSEDELVPLKLLLKEHDLEVDTSFTVQYYEELEIDFIYPESARLYKCTPCHILH